ncbi:MAG: hypothetical protein M3Y57_03745 [Acidobacteriota bacterium]|nr:hypothetical protein [Acidobacteriota bacterium]
MNDAQEPAPLACNLSALTDPARYRTLLEQLRSALSGSAELPDGYSYSVQGELLSLVELGEWISLERFCCPFLNFELSVSGTESLYWLTLTGPEGVKPILEKEFQA